MYCNERCPKGVDPRDAIEKLGGIAFQEKVTRDKGARHAKAFLISMRTGGKLNESLLVPFTKETVPNVDIEAGRITAIPPAEAEPDAEDWEDGGEP